MGRGAQVVLALLAAACVVLGCSTAPDASGSHAPPTLGDDFPNPAPTAPAQWAHLERKQEILGGIFGGDGNQFVTGAAAYRDGFVVIGYRFISDQDVTGMIWTSPNGVDWTSVDEPEAKLDDAELSWITTDGSTLLAIGARRPGDGAVGPPPVVWSSSDGGTWRRVADSPPVLADVGVRSLAGHDGRFLVLGVDRGGNGRLVSTTDGVEWTRIETDAFGNDEINTIAPYRGGWIAVGAQHSVEPPAPGRRPTSARAWWSADGTTWARAAVAEGPALTNVYPGAAGVFGIGSPDCGGCVSSANLWAGDGRGWRLLGPDRLTWPAYAGDGSRIIAWDFQGGGSFAWSTDGLAWTPFGDPLKDERAFGAIVVGTKGVLLPLGSNGEPVDAGVLFLEAS
jgi:hypothetical protein